MPLRLERVHHRDSLLQGELPYIRQLLHLARVTLMLLPLEAATPSLPRHLSFFAQPCSAVNRYHIDARLLAVDCLSPVVIASFLCTLIPSSTEQARRICFREQL
jgi:hypothetical protein